MIEIKPIASSSSGNAYIVNDGHSPILIECGIQIKRIRQAVNFKLAGIAGALVSHYHNDHAGYVKDVMRAGVDVYTSQGTADELNLSGHRLHIIEPLKQLTIGSWTILPFETEHDCKGALGFLLQTSGEKLLFMTDTAYCRYRFKGVTRIMIECDYQTGYLKNNESYSQALKNRIIKTHFSLENVLDFLRATDLSKLQEIWLIHLSRYNVNPAEAKKAVQRLTGIPVYVAAAE